VLIALVIITSPISWASEERKRALKRTHSDSSGGDTRTGAGAALT
jgi:hypothetical protein